MKLNHLHLKAANLSQTREFYERYFGFKKAFDHEGAAFLVDEGGMLLAIFEYKKDEPRFKFPEWFHFGFCQDKETKVRDLYTQMRRDKVPFAAPLKEHKDGSVFFYCLDPAGHKIEVSFNQQESQQVREQQPSLARARR